MRCWKINLLYDLWYSSTVVVEWMNWLHRYIENIYGSTLFRRFFFFLLSHIIWLNVRARTIQSTGEELKRHLKDLCPIYRCMSYGTFTFLFITHEYTRNNLICMCIYVSLSFYKWILMEIDFMTHYNDIHYASQLIIALWKFIRIHYR